MPPIRHMVLFKFVATAGAEDITIARGALMELPSIIPNILFYDVYHLARDLCPNDSFLNDGYTLMLDSIFSDKPALANYGPHPAHQAVQAKIGHLRDGLPLIVDYALPTTFSVESFRAQQRAPRIRHLSFFTADASEMDNMKAACTQMLEDISGALDVSFGYHSPEDMGPAYRDLSRGITSVLDLVLEDAKAFAEYTMCDGHKQYVQKNLSKPGTSITFTYAA